MSVKVVKQNASTPRTRRKIHDAFMKLAESHDVSAITVNDVTSAAGLNRTTFYLHYSDIDALLDAVIEELIERLQEGGRRILEQGEAMDVPVQDTFFTTIAAHPALFLSLFGGTARRKLEARLLSEHKQWFLARWAQESVEPAPDGPDLESCAAFVAGGVHALMLHWLETGMTVPAETLSRWTLELGMSARPGALRMIDSRKV
jgi:AcrR family transcriptional regulator